MNAIVTINSRMVGKPSFTGLWKGCPLSPPQLPCTGLTLPSNCRLTGWDSQAAARRSQHCDRIIKFRWPRHFLGRRRISVETTVKADHSVLPRWKSKSWILPATAVVSFAAGGLFTSYVAHLREVRADGDRVFELMIYHTVPDKVPTLES